MIGPNTPGGKASALAIVRLPREPRDGETASMSDRQPDDKRPPVSPWAFASIGFELAVPLVLFMYLGYRLDGWVGTEKPVFLLAGALLGMVVGFYTLAKRILATRTRGDEDRD
jgi:F0F1-type ATP synthase assembly protein I